MDNQEDQEVGSLEVESLDGWLSDSTTTGGGGGSEAASELTSEFSCSSKEHDQQLYKASIHDELNVKKRKTLEYAAQEVITTTPILLDQQKKIKLNAAAASSSKNHKKHKTAVVQKAGNFDLNELAPSDDEAEFNDDRVEDHTKNFLVLFR